GAGCVSPDFANWGFSQLQRTERSQLQIEYGLTHMDREWCSRGLRAMGFPGIEFLRLRGELPPLGAVGHFQAASANRATGFLGPLLLARFRPRRCFAPQRAFLFKTIQRAHETHYKDLRKSGGSFGIWALLSALRVGGGKPNSVLAVAVVVSVLARRAGN